METIEQRALKLRKELGLSQTEFAKVLSLSHGSISRWETGRDPISEQNIKMILFAFNVNEEWLLEGKGEMFRSVETDEIQVLLGIFDKLIDINKKLIINHADYLLKSQQDLQASNSAVTPGSRTAILSAGYPLEPLSDSEDGFEEEHIVG
jgi:transcriptional regulator with XRE-family HTH domain